MSGSDDDDVPTLSAHTLAALQEFYEETGTGPDHKAVPSDLFSVGALKEDWVSSGRFTMLENFFTFVYINLQHGLVSDVINSGGIFPNTFFLMYHS